MNVNGSRFHLFLGKSDWRRCLVHTEDAWRRLAEWWPDINASPPSPAGPMQTLELAPLTWDARREELRLQSLPIEIGATPGETPFTLEERRAAAADRYGNIYWIDGDRHRLRVWSVGSDRESAFWPDGPVDCTAAHRPARSDFEPSLTTTAPADRVFTALAVTEDHYLVVAFTSPSANGLLAFDLMAGGPPVETLWPTAVDFWPFDMARRCGGGVWVLDRANRRLWELDRHLAVVSGGQTPTTLAPVEVDVFQPPTGAPRERPAAVFPAGIDLSAVPESPIDPISVQAAEDGSVLILDRNEEGGNSRVFRLREGDAVTAHAPAGLNQLAHDFVLGKATVRGAGSTPVQLFVATASGNQALAFVISAETQAFSLRGAVELFPLRRFGGRALLEVRDTAYYDSGVAKLRWVPVVQQPRARYLESAELITPVLDGRELQCVWDRVMLDACIPADSRIEVWCRAADERVGMETASPSGVDDYEIIGGWTLQPRPYLRGDGAELPWLRAEAVRVTRRELGTGTWELLLQNARGRYLQLRLRLSGNGAVTPWVRALRAWYPRFSYPQRFLPAVYREDPFAGSFIDRFLANMEGINTTIEGRIVQAQALFDARTAPAESLGWLAEWFDVALDPTWDEWRRRLFIKHATDFFRWRGTVHGLRLALAIAFDAIPRKRQSRRRTTGLESHGLAMIGRIAGYSTPRVDDDAFGDPNPYCDRPESIRIVEAYLTRRVGALVAGDPGAAESGPRTVARESLWTPQEGNSGLVERFLGRDATPSEQVNAFSLMPPFDPGWSIDEVAKQQAHWRTLCELHLGFIPGAGADERKRWQHYLLTHVSPDDLAARYGIQYPHVGAIDLPAEWPSMADVAEDWRAYCALPSPTRTRWQDFLARRYRRIERLNTAYQTAWPAFDFVPLPDHLPATTAAQTDWLHFERHLLAMVRTAHRFSVLLPVSSVTEDPFEMERRLALARRIVELEKPAHTVFDVRFYWELNRIGEARLGLDTLLDVGSRAPQLLPDAVLGRAYVGASFVGGTKSPTDGDRRLLAC